jgi:Glycosyl hydrolases family 6
MRTGALVVLLVAGLALLGWTGPNSMVQAIDQTIPTASSSYLKYNRPHALWLTADQKVGDNVGPLYQYLTLSQQQQRRPEVVIYFIPERDLGESSEGGFATFEQYFAENRLLANTIAQYGKRSKLKPRVYLEPDALGHAISFQRQRQYDSRSVRTYEQRTQAMRQLVGLYQQAGGLVYLDIAHSQWMSTPDDVQAMADTLKASGITQAHGLVTNISNRQPVTLPAGQVMGRTEWGYVQELMAALPAQPLDVVIDTSRNGGTTRPRQYYLAPDGRLFDNQTVPPRLVGLWRKDPATGETWFHPFYGQAKAMTRLLTREKYTFDKAKQVLTAPAWLDPIGDVKVGPLPTDNPGGLASPRPGVHVRFRDVKPPDDCDGSLNCPPGQSKSWIIKQTEALQPILPVKTPPLE